MEPTPTERLVRIDPDYADRKGYDAHFLAPSLGDALPGSALPIVDLPFPSYELDPDIAECDDLAGGTTRILNYHHFSR